MLESLENSLSEFSKVNVWDSPCGSGKTSAMIWKINNEFEDEKIFYVTPYLDEVNRVIKNCKKRHFVEPHISKVVLEDGTEIWNKSNALLDLVRRGRNICTTHALLSNISDELIEALRSGNYVLILDEVFEVVKEYKSSSWGKVRPTSEERARNDIKKVMDMFIHHGAVTIDENTMAVVWHQDKADEAKVEQDRYEDVIRMAKRGLLYYISNSIVYWSFPIELFRDIFSQTYILTFMFEGQIQAAYYRYHGLRYEKWHPIKDIVNGEFVYTVHLTTDDEFERSWIRSVRNRIEIVEKESINRIGSKYYDNGWQMTSLSWTWFQRELEKENGIGEIEVLGRNAQNFFNNVAIDKDAGSRMWAVFLDAQESIMKGNPLLSKNGFVPIGTRAVNDFADRTALAYMVNRYYQPYIKTFFSKRDVKIDEDYWALSDLVQWVWRSNIRVTEIYEMITYKKKSKKNKKIDKEDPEKFDKERNREIKEKKWVEPKNIQIYIPSERMRTLFCDYLWFDEN